MTKKPREKDLQFGILEWLHLKGIFAWKHHSGGITRADGRGIIPVGLRGVSDILGVLPDGRFLAIEVKRPGGKPTAEQTAFLDNIARNNGVAFVAHSLDEVIKILPYGLMAR